MDGNCFTRQLFVWRQDCPGLIGERGEDTAAGCLHHLPSWLTLIPSVLSIAGNVLHSAGREPIGSSCGRSNTSLPPLCTLYAMPSIVEYALLFDTLQQRIFSEACRTVRSLCRQYICGPTKPPPPLCDILSGGCFFTGPWTLTRSSLRMLRRVAAFCRPLRPVLLLVSFPRSRSPVVGVPGLCWMWRDVPFARQRRTEAVLVVAGVV